MHPDDMDRLGLNAGDLVEVYNDHGQTAAIVQPTESARTGEGFVMFGNATGVRGNVVFEGVNRLIIPNYKQTWGGIRKLADAPEGVRHLSFTSQEYRSL